MDRFLPWVQPVITVVSLTFGGGILYGDVQELKRNSEEAGELNRQVQVIETKLAYAQEERRRTVIVLDRMVDVVERLNASVAKLEARLEERE